MSYVIAAISNAGGAPEQAYRKMQSAGACPERPFAGTDNVAMCECVKGKYAKSTFW
jgi:hypothetical protein